MLIEPKWRHFPFCQCKNFFDTAQLSCWPKFNEAPTLYEKDEVSYWHIFKQTHNRMHRSMSVYITKQRVKLFERVKLLSIDEQNGHCALLSLCHFVWFLKFSTKANNWIITILREQNFENFTKKKHPSFNMCHNQNSMTIRFYRLAFAFIIEFFIHFDSTRWF